jgi:hypothetical protein
LKEPWVITRIDGTREPNEKIPKILIMLGYKPPCIRKTGNRCQKAYDHGIAHQPHGKGAKRAFIISVGVIL